MARLLYFIAVSEEQSSQIVLYFMGHGMQDYLFLVDLWDTFGVIVLSTAVAECFQNVTKIELSAILSPPRQHGKGICNRATQAAVAHGCKNVFFGRSLEQTKRARPLYDISGNIPKRYQNIPFRLPGSQLTLPGSQVTLPG